MQWVPARRVAILCTAACAALTAASIHPLRPRATTEDRNGDGRPDVWRRYSDQGELIEVDIDSNFDGRPDILESYERGVLVRRDSDRNFNDRVDLVEEFDASTHEHVRSVVDIDDDGTADLLVLFQEGRPVFSKYAPQEVARPGVFRRNHAGLTPLSDPFRAELSVSGVRLAGTVGHGTGLSTSGGLPEWGTEPRAPTLLARSPSTDVDSLLRPVFLAGSPRAPPSWDREIGKLVNW